MNTDEHHRAAQMAAEQGYLLANLSDGLRITFNGVTIKRWPGSYDVAPVVAWLAEQKRKEDAFWGRA